MLRALLFAAGVAIAAAGSVRYDPATHTAVGSKGCGSKSPYALGTTTTAHGMYAGVSWLYLVRMPKQYDAKTPTPLIIHHHGWGMTAKAEEKGAGIAALADQLNVIVVTPQGEGDNTHSGGPWYSWNAVGTTRSPGPAGATCTSKANHASYCYTSCGSSGKELRHNSTRLPAWTYSYTYSYDEGTSNCKDSPQCWWTTCDETVTPTGTGLDPGGFIPGLYDTMESQLCIDLTREYGSGESNGGMQTYQLGVDLASRLAAIFPEFGSFHRGFAMAPKVGVPVLDLHGTKDTTVPGNVSLSADGYYYTTTDEIFNGGKYSTGWKKANGCHGPSSHWPTKYDGQHKFYCVLEGDCPGGDVIRCSWDGGHNWLFNNAAANGGLVTMFLLEWTKPTHIGYGRTAGQPPSDGHPLNGVAVLAQHEDLPNATSAFAALPSTLEPPLGASSHYGNPADGCLPDEDTIEVGTGHTCAPRVQTSTTVEAGGALPEPKCHLGGSSSSHNGCPKDALVPTKSKAWPICLAKDSAFEPSPYENGHFHCLLVCPCAAEGVECGAESDAHCPQGARCERGELRNRAHGVCTY
jgi:poly(3-hydroxybutyrate) depolymerase